MNRAFRIFQLSDQIPYVMIHWCWTWMGYSLQGSLVIFVERIVSSMMESDLLDP